MRRKARRALELRNFYDRRMFTIVADLRFIGVLIDILSDIFGQILHMTDIDSERLGAQRFFRVPFSTHQQIKKSFHESQASVSKLGNLSTKAFTDES